ncbi:39S ribosomal protein L47 [Spatholobus suberectus]|nr:39S ribosomal protein L47 [Spatholobus suberectus]
MAMKKGERGYARGGEDVEIERKKCRAIGRGKGEERLRFESGTHYAGGVELREQDLTPSFTAAMFLSRAFGRTLLAAAARSKPYATTAAAGVKEGHNPLQEFFEADRSPDDDKPVVYGRSWKASELRLNLGMIFISCGMCC